jgi:predicted SprT family Zn-dependent metalloprotease
MSLPINTVTDELLTDCCDGLAIYERLNKLVKNLTIEWSSRLKRNLAVTYPKRNLIRINKDLILTENRHLLTEVIVHELAHIAAYLETGSTKDAHGEIWKRHVKEAGYQPGLSLALNSNPESLSHKATSSYIHTCPICQSQRTAKRPMSVWRCTSCINNNLSGELVISKKRSSP